MCSFADTSGSVVVVTDLELGSRWTCVGGDDTPVAAHVSNVFELAADTGEAKGIAVDALGASTVHETDAEEEATHGDEDV